MQRLCCHVRLPKPQSSFFHCHAPQGARFKSVVIVYAKDGSWNLGTSHLGQVQNVFAKKLGKNTSFYGWHLEKILQRQPIQLKRSHCLVDLHGALPVCFKEISQCCRSNGQFLNSIFPALPKAFDLCLIQWQKPQSRWLASICWVSSKCQS